MTAAATTDPFLGAALNYAADLFAAPPPPRWETPGALAQHIDPRTVQTPALDLIDAELTRLLDTPDGRLIISMPPQEGKSVRVGRDFPIWALMQNPYLRIITGSYGQGLANRNGRTVRNAIITNPDVGLAVAPDHGAASEWTIDGHDGGVLSVGRGAGVTGRPADLLIIDDPIKDRAEADSLTIRDTAWDWWTDALSARLAPGAPVVLILTRWHEDDLAGRLVEHDAEAGWRVLNIPAQCEDPATDPLGREHGEYMISARRRTREQWEQRKRTAGSRTWNALYQGRPSPAEGGAFRREWWRRWTQPPQLHRVIQSWDMAFKGTDKSDFVVGQVWATDGADSYLLDQVRGRWTFTETVAQVRQLRDRWPMTSATLVEDKANGTAVIDSLNRSIPGLVPVQPQGGKETRAAAVSPLVEAGNVWLPPDGTCPWVGALIEEAAAFPQGSHDDQVDALSQALAYLHITQPAQRVGTGFFDIG